MSNRPAKDNNNNDGASELQGSMDSKEKMMLAMIDYVIMEATVAMIDYVIMGVMLAMIDYVIMEVMMMETTRHNRRR